MERSPLEIVPSFETGAATLAHARAVLELASRPRYLVRDHRRQLTCALVCACGTVWSYAALVTLLALRAS
jgi:hypothetical protein